jgi:hypothetical protein
MSRENSARHSYCTTAVFIGLGFVFDPLVKRFLEVADELVDAELKKVCREMPQFCPGIRKSLPISTA